MKRCMFAFVLLLILSFGIVYDALASSSINPFEPTIYNWVDVDDAQSDLKKMIKYYKAYEKKHKDSDYSNYMKYYKKLKASDAYSYNVHASDINPKVDDRDDPGFRSLVKLVCGTKGMNGPAMSVEGLEALNDYLRGYEMSVTAGRITALGSISFWVLDAIALVMGISGG